MVLPHSQLVMEYCRCGSLSSYIQSGNKLSEPLIRDICACSLFGIAYLHSKNVFHRVLHYFCIDRRISSQTTC